MLAMILLGTLVVTLLGSFFVARRLERARQPAKVHCAEKGGDYQVDVLVQPKPWNYGDEYAVVRCTAFRDPDHVTCDKHCLGPIVDAIQHRPA
jgi:hypothetical protein